MKNKKGFSLVELIISIIIVGILSIIGVASYRGYIKKAMRSEAMAVIAEMSAAEEMYYAKNNCYYSFFGNTKQSISQIGVDFSRNKYFKEVWCYASGLDPVQWFEFSLKYKGSDIYYVRVDRDSGLTITNVGEI